MSISVMSSVLSDGEITDIYEFSLLMVLADHCDDRGVCYPSMTRVAKRARMSVRKAQNVVKGLRARGVIAINENAGPKGCNVFTVSRTPAPSAPPNDVHPRTPRRHPPHTTTPPPARRADEPSENHQEPSEGGQTDLPTIAVTKPRPKKPKRKRCSLPNGWVPNDRNLSDALKKNLTTEETQHEADKFRDHHHSRGSEMADWDAAWRTWLSRVRRYGSGPASSGNRKPGQGTAEAFAAVGARLQREQGGS